jgi:hypothetical protein
LNPALVRTLERLAAARIEMVSVPGLMRHFVFARDGYAALVERATGVADRSAGFGQIGAAGRVTGRGFEALMWRDGQAWFVAKQYEQEATDEQVAMLRRFHDDLRAALDDAGR